jgi:hypothetical protein
MANRRIEIHQYYQIIQRLRQGESDRAIASAERIGRVKIAAVRKLAGERGWLLAGPMPDEAMLSAALCAPRRTPQNLSTVEPYREKLLAWHAQGIPATTMHRALVRNHEYSGSVYALYRFLDREGQSTPQATVMLEFAVGESAQVDFGQGPVITDRRTGEVIKTWVFVMKCGRPHFITNVAATHMWCRARRKGRRPFPAPHKVCYSPRRNSITPGRVLHDFVEPP